MKIGMKFAINDPQLGGGIMRASYQT